MKEDCIFCKLASGIIPTKYIWEDENYIAFLDINPMVRGMTLVIPKKHTNSNIMKLDNKVIGEMMDAVKKVAHILDEKLEGNLRTALHFEGLEVPHLHAKLVPMYKGDVDGRQAYETTTDELLELTNFLAN